MKILMCVLHRVASLRRKPKRKPENACYLMGLISALREVKRALPAETEKKQVLTNNKSSRPSNEPTQRPRRFRMVLIMAPVQPPLVTSPEKPISLEPSAWTLTRMPRDSSRK